MRYLVLSADYLRPNLRDQAIDQVELDEAGLSAQLTAEILAWNEKYQQIIQLDAKSRAERILCIDELDEKGIELASKVSQELRPAKVGYYSEGRLSRLK